MPGASEFWNAPQEREALSSEAVHEDEEYVHEVGFDEGADRTGVEWRRDMLGMEFGGEGIGQLFERA